MSEVEKSNVEHVEIMGSEVKGKLKDGSSFKTTVPDYPDLVKNLMEKNVSIKVKECAEPSGWPRSFQGSFCVVNRILDFFMPDAKRRNKALSFGKSRAKRFLPNRRR
jgi:ATP-dependent Zn protease